MAAYVCYRFCCRQLQQHASRFRSLSLVRPSSQAGKSSVLRPAGTVLVFPSCVSLCHSARPYHCLARQRGTLRGLRDWRTVVARSFRSHREQTVTRSGVKDKRHGLLRPFMFTVFTCTGSFIGCMVWQYEALRQKAQEVMKGLDRQMNRMFEPTYQKQMGFRAHMNAMWNNLSDGQKMVMGIIGLNFLVFFAWKAPSLHPMLLRYFSSMPGNPTVSMVLSAFSHFNLWHIAANMYVLWSFAGVSINLFGREQWLAVYISAASVSSLASLANKVLRHSSMPVAPSLGASGAIMCLLGAICVTHPDARLSIAFVGELFPHSFSASSALKAILLLDTVGLVMGWRMFDHAAHLGGVLFGIWYVSYGHKMIWGQREKILRQWHEIRGKPSK